MSLLSDLQAKKGATHSRKRVGRGDASGWGGTSGKGHKGQKARSGGKVRRSFEGGQTPLVRRIPKFGFKSPFRNPFQAVNLDQLERFEGEVSLEQLQELAGSKKVKVLGRGELTKTLTVHANAFSNSAKEAIEKAGGKVEVVK